MPDTTPYKPAIPNVVRTVVYVVGLAVGFLSILTIGLGVILWPGQAQAITAAAGVVGTAVGWLASALGTAYHPTSATVAASSVGD